MLKIIKQAILYFYIMWEKYIKKGNDMKIKVYSLLSIGIFMSQSTQAKRFIEGWHSALKLNPNMYAFGADVDNTIGQKNLNFFADWKTTTTSQEKHALSLPYCFKYPIRSNQL